MGASSAHGPLPCLGSHPHWGARAPGVQAAAQPAWTWPHCRCWIIQRCGRARAGVARFSVESSGRCRRWHWAGHCLVAECHGLALKPAAAAVLETAVPGRRTAGRPPARAAWLARCLDRGACRSRTWGAWGARLPQGAALLAAAPLAGVPCCGAAWRACIQVSDGKSGWVSASTRTPIHPLHDLPGRALTHAP